ncbi:FUSC family protein [Nakamurella flavida]|uniref:FUSC family protein n=1 Tax=Nakamurella flavida TaxID=363630 RepID=A0A939C7F9_9ACTN|nr:FUSC family protein [Nakamurella flavida]MBM9478127.1 FUSC family protein [Nakamurella flavida]MDP9778651.1 putative membrane protein YccC [Nakamurella flavida]
MNRTAPWVARLATSDPGLLRLRLALRGAGAVGLIALVAHFVGPWVGIPSVAAMLIGGSVGLQGSFAASGRPPRDVVRVLVWFPLVAAAGAVPAALLSSDHPVQVILFAVLLVLAVFVRRFGLRAQMYGMLGWFAYFFTSFTGFTLDTLPGLLALVVVATGCVILVGAVLFPDRPAAVYTAARRAFTDRVTVLISTAADVVGGSVTTGDGERRLHAAGLRLVEVSLIVEGYLSQPGSLPEGTAESVAVIRRRLLDAELAADELAEAVTQLRHDGMPEQVRTALADALRVVGQGDVDRGREQLRQLDDRLADDHDLDEVRSDVEPAVTAARRLLAATADPLTPAPTGDVTFEGAVALMGGNLPSSANSAKDIAAAQTPRLSLNTRMTIQAAIAAPITVLLGELISPSRYYWALLACLLVLTGTFTTGEVTAKGINRVVGTVAGLGAATLAVHITGTSGWAIVGVMLVCVFLGLYFFRVSYAVMAFAVTTLLGEIYNVLNEFTRALLLTRIIETVVGAAVAVLVVLVILPIRTADARHAAHRAFLIELGALLGDIAVRLREPGRQRSLALDARRLDAQLHQYATVSRPAAGATMLGLARPGALTSISAFTQVAYRARALAASVIRLEPGSRPDLADRCDLLRQEVAVTADPPPPWTPGPDDAMDRRLNALRDAVRALPGGNR